jgi:DNA-binding transcriptional MerR regulator
VYSIHDLSTITGVSVRTIRYYVQQGVIPPAKGRGRGLNWGDEHVRALRQAIRILKDDRVTVADLAERNGYRQSV